MFYCVCLCSFLSFTFDRGQACEFYVREGLPYTVRVRREQRVYGGGSMSVPKTPSLADPQYNIKELDLFFDLKEDC